MRGKLIHYYEKMKEDLNKITEKQKKIMDLDNKMNNYGKHISNISEKLFFSNWNCASCSLTRIYSYFCF